MNAYERRHELAPGARQTSTAWLCLSHDDGASFGEPWMHSVIQGPSDHLVSGCCFSDDNGRTWKAATQRADLPLRGAMEPHIVELPSGELLMYLRTQLGAVFESRSADRGRTWSAPQTTGLRAPESMPTLARIPSTGDLLLVWNDAPYWPQCDQSGKRTPVTVAISRDQGATWQHRRNIETTRSGSSPTRRSTLLPPAESSSPTSPPSWTARSRPAVSVAVYAIEI